MIKQVIRYETSDGQLFNTEQDAIEYRENQIGELLDSILPYDDRGNMTRSDRHNILMKMIDSKNRRFLSEQINKLNHILNTEWLELDLMSEYDKNYLDSYR